MSDLTLKGLVQLALANDVDFEVWNGVNISSKGKPIQAHMIIEMPGMPRVQVSFGDKKHGQRVNRIHVAGMHTVPVKASDLTHAMEKHRVETDWRRMQEDMDVPEPTLLHITTHNGQVNLQGTINKDGDLEVPFFQRVESDPEGQFFQVTDTFRLTEQTHEGWVKPDLVEGMQVSVVGDYVFPNTINALSIV